MILDQAKVFHHGIIVADIQSALETLTREQGLSFSRPWTSPARIRLAGTGEIKEVEFTMVYSGEGPVHVELVQQIPGTIWVTDGDATLHHVGYWTDDLVADGNALEAGGFELVFENVPDNEGEEPSYRYYRSALGLYIELVHTSLRQILEDLWAATLAPRSAQTVERSIHIEAPAESVWGAVRPFGEHDKWMESIAQSADYITWVGEPNEPGAERRFDIPGQPLFVERLVRVDEDARELAYTLAEFPMAIDDHESVIVVTEDGDGSLVTWTARFVADDGTAAMLDGFMGSQTFEPGLAGLKVYAETT